MKKTIILLILSINFCFSLAGCETKKTDKTVNLKNQQETVATPKATPDHKKLALQEYFNILSQKKYNNEDKQLEKTHFAINDLDSNGIPELIIAETHNVLSARIYYTYENGNVIKLEGPDEPYPAYGGLYPQPARNTYVFFRGGPGYQDEESGNGYMPYTLIEYKIENNQIRKIREAFWQRCDSGDKAGETEYTLNNEPCSAEEIEGQYQLGNLDHISFVMNTEANRNLFAISPSSADD